MKISNRPASLSVIIPVYNVEEYLTQCVESVLRLSVSTEIILVNDGSTDSSGEIAERFRLEHENVIVIHQRNRGLSAARNKGMSIARGEYLAFLDSDDWVEENSLDRLCRVAAENRLDAVMGHASFCCPDGYCVNPFPRLSGDFVNKIHTGKECFIELMRTGCYVPMAPCFICRREWIKRRRFKFQNVIHEDELWTPAVLCHAERMIVTGLVFYNYRQRADSIMHASKAAARVHSLFEICDRLILFINTRYMKNGYDREIGSWLYVKVYMLYDTAFQLLLKIKTSDFILPPHQLYSIRQLEDKLEREPFERCLVSSRHAKQNLKKYLRYRLSPQFGLKNKRRNDQLLILIYNTMWDEPFPAAPEEIPEDCMITTDRHYFPQADAVVFHLPTLYGELENDLDKPENQIWIAWSLECEENYPFLKDPEFMGLFDLRMSYHAGADIVYPYYTYDYLTEIYRRDNPLNRISRICMLISSPFNQSKRTEYLQELMQYTETDSFGRLFNTKKLTDDRGRKSKMELYSKYKFVIAFENSIAPDYVTEKFFDPLLAGSVPVYLGAPNIEEFAPGENCFVDVRMFENPRRLADFINNCYQNEELYLNFFHWKNHPLLPSFGNKVKAQKINPFLLLCSKVREIRGNRV